MSQNKSNRKEEERFGFRDNAMMSNSADENEEKFPVVARCFIVHTLIAVKATRCKREKRLAIRMAINFLPLFHFVCLLIFSMPDLHLDSSYI